MLASPHRGSVHAGRQRESRPEPHGDEPVLSKDGFSEEALPWLDAVHHFALHLTAGDRQASEDLAQERFLRAYRFWHTFERGTNAKSWLFTICRNIYLREKEKLSHLREEPAADLDERVEALTGLSAFGQESSESEREFFDRLIDDEVIEAIDELPEQFREVLVLSDLGDLQYTEIAEVLQVHRSER